MAQYREQPSGGNSSRQVSPRQMWIALLTGMATGYVALMAFYLGFG